MSSPVVLIVAEQVYGPRFPVHDHSGNDTTTITFPADAGAKVLFVKGGSKHNVKQIILGNLYHDDMVTPKSFSILPLSFFCTLSSSRDFQYSICVAPNIVKKIHEVYRGDSPPLPDKGCRNSVHFIYIKNPRSGKSIFQALVFFRNEVFCKADRPSPDHQVSGVSFRTAISFAFMSGFKSSAPPNDNIYFLVVHKNSDMKCWCIQLLNAFNFYFGVNLFNIMQRIDSFAEGKALQFSLAVNSFEESEKGRFNDLYDLFLSIHEYFAFCYNLKEVTVLDIAHLRSLIASCKLLGCRFSPVAQEDPHLLGKLLELFAEFHSYLLRIPIEEFPEFLLDDKVNPCINLKYAMSISYRCTRCGHESHSEKITYQGGFQVNPHTTAIQDAEGFTEALHTLSASFMHRDCPRCKGALLDHAYEGKHVLKIKPGAKFIIDPRLNSDNRAPDRQKWYIPTGDFLLGNNICRCRQLIMNRSTGNFGAHGHCYGGIIRGEFLYLLDDGAPPIPLENLDSASETVSLLLCQVVGEVPQRQYRDYIAKVEEAQRIEHAPMAFNFIVSTLNGIEQNLHAEIANLKHEWEASKTDLHRAALEKKVTELMDRIETLKGAIDHYKDNTPECERDPELPEIVRKMETEKDYGDSLLRELPPS